MVKDQAQIEQVSELERWFVSEYRDRFFSVWIRDIESNKLNELDKDKVLWILEILNKHPVNMSDLAQEFRDLFYFLSHMVDVSLKMKFPSLIVETLKETEDLVKAYVLFNKDIYSNEEQSDIESKIQDFFALQYLGFNQYLKNFRRSLSSSLEEVKDDKNLYQKILKMSEVINSSLKYIDDTQNKFKTIIEKDFKSCALKNNPSKGKVTSEAGNIKQKKIPAKLIRKLEKYLGSRRPKSVFFKGELSSMQNFTWEKINISVDEIIRILKDEIALLLKSTRHNDLRDVGKLYTLLSFAEYKSSLKEVEIELNKKVQNTFDANSLDKEKTNQTKWVFELIAEKILERNRDA